MEIPQPTSEHELLKSFCGEFVASSDHSEAQETARMIGDLWLLIEGNGMAGSIPHNYLFTIGFDKAKGKYVGSFVCAMMDRQWLYEGHRSGDRICLYSTGPACDGSGAEWQYRDWFWMDGPNRMLMSEHLDDAGNWNEFMRSTSVPKG
jgi:hypothetical protein